MKVLFALGNEQLSKRVAEKYFEKYGEEIEYKNVFYFKALLDEVKKDKTYDRIVIKEELEQFQLKNIESLDRFIFNNIDNVTDEIEDSEIIFICSDRRTKDHDKFVERLFNIGVYNTLIGDERVVSSLCDYIKKPMNKKEAKRHLNINSVVSDGTISTRDDEVEEIQIMNILKYYENIKGKTEEYIPAFDRIAEQYNRNQLKVILFYLNPDVKKVILSSDKYKFLDDSEVEQGEGNTSNTKELKSTANKPKKKGLFSILKEGKFKEVRKQPNVIVDENANIQEKLKKEAEVVDEQDEIETKEQEEIRLREEAEARQQAELKARAEQEAKLREEAELQRQQAELQRQQAEREAKAREEAELQKQQAELKAKAEREAKAREEEELQRQQAELKAKAEQEENIIEKIEVNKQQAELKAMAEREAKEREEEELRRQQAELRAKVEQDAKEKKLEQEKFEEERKRLEQEKLALEEERRKLQEQSEKISKTAEAVSNAAMSIQPQVFDNRKIDVKKMVVFVGANKSGTTFLTNAIAHDIASQNVSVGIIDMTKDKSLYYIYNQDDKELRAIAAECMKKLGEGVDSYIQGAKNLKIYTSVPGPSMPGKNLYRNKAVIDTVTDSNALVIVDADFSTPLEYFEKAQDIYIIQDMDIIKMQETTMFIRELKNRSIDMKKIKILINKYVKSLLTPKKIIQGLSYYNDPQMSFIDELLDSKVQYYIVPFNIDNYAKYIDGVYKNSINYSKFSDDFKQAISEISNDVYRRSNGAVQQTRRRGFFG